MDSTFLLNKTFYDWTDNFYDEKGSLRADDVLKAIFSMCNNPGTKELKLSAFADEPGFESLNSDKTNKDAILWISESQTRMGLLYDFMEKFDNLKNNMFLYKACYISGTTESALKLRTNYLVHFDELKLNNFFRNSKGLFAISENHIVQILNEENTVILQVPNVLAPFTTTHLTEANNGFVFQQDLLDGKNHKTGYQVLYYYNIEQDSVSNLFEELPNKNTFEIYSFSASGDNVFYSGVQGGGYVSCKVSISTLKNEIIDVAYKLSDIAVLD